MQAIEIITEKVEMPELYERRFEQKHENNKWSVIDTETNITVYKGKYEDVCLAWHNLNKKYYQQNPINKK